MKTNYLFEVNTPLGTRVRTTKSYWNLIQIKHPEVTDKLALIKSVLKMPDLITKSKTDGNILLFYKKISNYWLCVVTRSSNIEGFIITAYITDKIKEGEKIWGN